MDTNQDASKQGIYHPIGAAIGAKAISAGVGFGGLYGAGLIGSKMGSGIINTEKALTAMTSSGGKIGEALAGTAAFFAAVGIEKDRKRANETGGKASKSMIGTGLGWGVAIGGATMGGSMIEQALKSVKKL